MTRLYQGIDLVEIEKFKEVFTRHGDFATDIFTKQEREYCQSKKDPLVHFAGRFAAKEACIKALGRGLSGTGIDRQFQEIEVSHHASGRPVLSVSGWTDSLRKKKKIDQLTVSISHSERYAVASVILVGR